MFIILISLLTILVLVLLWHWYLLWRDQRNLIDFQQQYHKTMSPLQIRKSRRFFWKSELAKNHKVQRIWQLRRLSSFVIIGLLVVLIVQLAGGSFWRLPAQPGFTLTLGILALILGLNYFCLWLTNRWFLRLTALNPGSLQIELSGTPTKYAVPFMRHSTTYLISAWSIVFILMLGSLGDVFKVSAANHFVHEHTQWLVPRDTATPKAQRQSEVSSNTQSTKPSPQGRSLRDAAYVQGLKETKLSREISNQEEVGLLTMYYLALTHADPDGIANDQGAAFSFHRLNNYDPTTFVIKRRGPNGDEQFLFLASVSAGQTVKMYQFINETGALTALHGLVPKYREIKDSQIPLGKLVTAYYTTTDGPYHRTMDAMQAGTQFNY